MSTTRETCPPKMDCPVCKHPVLEANMHCCHGCGSPDCDGEGPGCSAAPCDDPRGDCWWWRNETTVVCRCGRTLQIEVEEEAAELTVVDPRDL